MGNGDAGAGFGADEFVFGLRGPSGIEAFFQGAARAGRTAVADIGRLLEPWAGFLFIMGAMQGTGRTRLAILDGTGGLGAQTGQGTSFAMQAIVEGPAETAGLFEPEMAANFFGDGGAVLAKVPANGFKGAGPVQGLFDADPVG